MDPEHHDVYNAKSRSVKLPPLLSSLSLENRGTQAIISREDLCVDGARVFVLHNFLNSEECQFFIEATEGMLLF